MKKNKINFSEFNYINETSKIQNALIDLFYEYHKICEANNLIYNMYGGTLLGAVRHHNIIPWDDDIDVSMPRADYEKFISLVNTKFNDRFEVYVYPKLNYVYPFAKFCLKNTILLENLRDKYNKSSLYIDIFPMDGCSCNEKQRKKDFAKLKKLKHSRGVCVDLIPKNNKLGGKILNFARICRSIMYRFLGYKRFLKKEIILSQKYNFKDSNLVCCAAASWFEKGIISKETYLNRKLYDFGKYKFWGIENYDKHLTNLYGNYLIPPSEEERISNHNYKLYFHKSLEENNNEQ